MNIFILIYQESINGDNLQNINEITFYSKSTFREGMIKHAPFKSEASPGNTLWASSE